MTMVTPWLLISATRRNVSSWRTGLSPALGSSSSSTAGSIMSARPIATIWRSPPERLPARWRRRFTSSGKSPPTKSNRSLNILGCWNSPISRFSSMVSEGNTLLFCGTMPTPLPTSLSALRPVMSSPLSSTLPSRMFTWPKTALSSVDLPAPFGPMMPIRSPWLATIEQPLRMLTPGR